jgi:hypothetical protein
MKCSRLAVWLPGLVVMIAATSAQAQQGPHIPNMAQRSGLIGRFVPMTKTNLPQDPDRDTFYGTYYANHYIAPNTNNMFNGGMYGQRLDSGCTSCRGPFFWGTDNSAKPLCADCQPKYKTQFGRVAAGFVNKWRPVGSYYQNGCTVPLYDFRPLAPGPGPDLWPFFINGSGG